MSMLCSCCNVETEKIKLITCFICKLSYNHACVGLTGTDLRNIAAKSALGMSWNCAACRGTTGDVLSEMRVLMNNLIKELAELKKQISLTAPAQHVGCDFEEVVREVEERRARKCNIILSGIAESTAAARDDRIEHEKELVNEIFGYLRPGMNVGDLSVSRLGKYDPDRARPRLLKVALSAETKVRDIVGNAKLLRNNPSYGNIRIFYDRTPRQTDYYNSLKAELSRRKDQGEENLRIKYVRGIPKIVSSN